MKKYIKWISLILLIISIIITIVLFVDFTKNKEKGHNDIINSLSEAYNKTWFRTEYSVYNKDKLVMENVSLQSKNYLIFEKEYIKYCDSQTEVCTNYNYQYQQETQTLTLNLENHFIEAGTYEMTIDDEHIYLTNKQNDITIIYLLECAKG